jgi:phage terminase large subunit
LSSPVLENRVLSVEAEFPEKLGELFTPSRYKFLYGGRGGSKSWGIARALILQSINSSLRILCAREYQKSIKESVHHLLVEQIDALKLTPFFYITDHTIKCLVTGSEFIFSGIKTNIQAIKSMEGVDRCWVEEAEKVSKESWSILIPTIRKEGSEIWVCFNPDLTTDPTWQYILNPPPDSIIIPIGFRDNPFFPETLRKEMESCRDRDPDAYDWIWEGNCRTITDANIIKRARIDTFPSPGKDVRLFFGADFGFADDPSTLDRMFIKDETLFIEYAAHAVHCELDDMPALYDTIPGSREWPIKADCSRPETISYLRRKGFNISAAEKWPGSVADGVAHLNAFKEIVIHERCANMDIKKCLNPFQETRMYCYKVDSVTHDILPVVVDKHNHHIDAWRYGLDGYVKRRGAGANLLLAVNS